MRAVARRGPAVIRALVVAALAPACSTSSEAPPPPAPTPVRPAPVVRQADGEWHCYTMDPETPVIAAGNVTHIKHRLTPERLETENVNVRQGVRAFSRFVYTRVGDRYENTDDGVMTVTLLTPDGNRQRLHYRSPTGWEFTDDTVYTDGAMTITSTDAGADGQPVKTTIRFVTAPCLVVDAELARYR